MNETVKLSSKAAPAAGTAATVAPNAILAIHGGDRLRKTPMPARMALGDEEFRMVQEAIDVYPERKAAPGYERMFEKVDARGSVPMRGGGRAVGGATGT